MTYQLIDEPGTGRGIVVRPVICLLALMLGGAWLAWPWFLWNAWSMESPTAKREAALVGGGLVVSGILAAALLHLEAAGTLSEAAFRYGIIFVVAWKLLIGYAVTSLQSRCFDLYAYFGGVVRNGWPILIAAFLVRPILLGTVGSLWLLIVLA